jgi:hypothetical protein
MYLVLKITRMLNFLGTFSMGVTIPLSIATVVDYSGRNYTLATWQKKCL